MDEKQNRILIEVLSVVKTDVMRTLKGDGTHCYLYSIVHVPSRPLTAEEEDVFAKYLQGRYSIHRSDV